MIQILKRDENNTNILLWFYSTTFSETTATHGEAAVLKVKLRTSFSSLWFPREEKVQSYYLMMQNTTDIKYVEINAGRREKEAESDSSHRNMFFS